MKKEKDIRQYVMFTQEPSSLMEAVYKRGFFNKICIILKENKIEIGELPEMTDCSTPICHDHKEKEK